VPWSASIARRIRTGFFEVRVIRCNSRPSSIDNPLTNTLGLRVTSTSRTRRAGSVAGPTSEIDYPINDAYRATGAVAMNVHRRGHCVHRHDGQHPTRQARLPVHPLEPAQAGPVPGPPLPRAPDRGRRERPLRSFVMGASNHPNHTVSARRLQDYLRWRNANARHPDVLAAQRRERARIRSERRQCWGRPAAA
jgi:hypothetical protein